MVHNESLRRAIRDVLLINTADDLRNSWSTVRRRTWLPIAGSLMATVAAGTAVAAEQATTDSDVTLQEVVVTGSRIATTLDNTSLPVLTISEKDIAKTGLTSVTDLVQNLPAMQGFVPASSSVNGGGGGVTTASLHSLPSKYSVVLVDGQRMTPVALGSVQGFGFAANLESIPLDAVERVEVLSDGASALYGADAIGGVVNFIMKKNRTDGTAFYNYEGAQSTGGGGWNAGISKGFGNLSEDGYNVFVTYSHDIQNVLYASQRAVSRQGAFFPFSSGGQNYVMFNPTSNTEPANITIGSLGQTFNPYYQANGNCGTPFAFPLTTAAGLNCRFNYAATVEDIPSSKRDSGMIKATLQLDENNKIWAEAIMSQYNMVAQFAPSAQPLGVSATRLPALWNAYVVPYLTATGQTATSATLNYRAVSAGGRTDDFGSQTTHLALGWDGSYFGWDFSATALLSQVKQTDDAVGGYLDADLFSAAVNGGAYDPVVGTGTSALQSSILHTQLSKTNSQYKALQIGAQHKVFQLSGGNSVLALGAEYDKFNYSTSYAPIVLAQSGYSTQGSGTDTVIGGSSGLVPFEADRANWGVYGEWYLPFLENLNVTASARYDSYQKTHTDYIFADTADPATGIINLLGGGSQGDSFAKTTFKLSFRYTPIQLISFRGSVGTGFKAPSVSDIVGPLAYNGSTSGTYACPFPGSVGCLPGSAQYDLLAGANGKSGAGALQPEKSTQWTFGIRLEPVHDLTMSFDYWNLKIKNQIQSAGIAEQIAYNNPQAYANLFVNPYTDPVGGFQTIALAQIPFNGGEANYSGIDWQFLYSLPAGRLGTFGVNWSGSYILKQNYTNYSGGPKLTDLGSYGPDQQVVFRIQSNLQFSLASERWTNSLSFHFKSGYTDQGYTADNAVVFAPGATAGTLGAPVDFPGLKVPSFTTADWQTSLKLRKNFDVTVGVRNLTNKKPPLSLQTGGGGNQVGYDGRYYDPTGRLYSLRAQINF